MRSLFRSLRKPISSPIPAGAVERVVERYKNGRARRSEFVASGQVVAGRLYDEAGFPHSEWGERGGKLHGVRLDWYERGVLISATPFQDGVGHGIAVQFDRLGFPIGEFVLEAGSGWEVFWEDEQGKVPPYLAEARYLEAGNRHGFEWWIGADQKTVNGEHHFKAGQAHGIERRWNAKGQLAKDYPRFFVGGKRVPVARYLTAMERDSTLPPVRLSDNQPARKFPPALRVHLRRPPSP